MTHSDERDTITPAHGWVQEQFIVRYQRVDSGLIHVEVQPAHGSLALLGYFHPTRYAAEIGEAIARCLNYG